MHEYENVGRDRCGLLPIDAAQTVVVQTGAARTVVVPIDAAQTNIVRIGAARIDAPMEGKEMEGKRIDMLIYNALY